MRYLKLFLKSCFNDVRAYFKFKNMVVHEEIDNDNIKKLMQDQDKIVKYKTYCGTVITILPCGCKHYAQTRLGDSYSFCSLHDGGLVSLGIITANPRAKNIWDKTKKEYE